MDAASFQHDPAHARTVWQSRRGMLELDLVFAPFVQHAYPHLTPAMQQAYQQLLELEDPYLYATVVLGKPCHDQHGAIVKAMRTFIQTDLPRIQESS